MKRLLAAAFAGLLLVSSLSILPPLASGEPGTAAYHASRVNIGFVGPIPSDIGTRVTSEGGRLIDRVTSLQMVVAEATQVSQAVFLGRMRSYADTMYAVEDILGTWALSPNDPLYSPDKLAPMNIEPAWDIHLGASSVLVAVIDTGVFCLHSDFQGAQDSACDARSPDVIDPEGHGTFVAGILAARINNNEGIAGVAQSTIYPLPVGSQLLLSNVVIRIMQAIELSVRIISMSGSVIINCEENDTNRAVCTPLRYAVENATSAGILFVASVGNENEGCAPGAPSAIAYPAAYPEVVATGASGGNARWDESTGKGSNCGPELDVLAPGHQITSTIPNPSQRWTAVCPGADYCEGSGTSAAVPHVSGLAALVWSKCPALSRIEVKNLIENNARNVSLPPWEQGRGIVNAGQTLGVAC